MRCDCVVSGQRLRPLSLHNQDNSFERDFAMNTKLRKWMPIALCCLPGVAIAAIIGMGIAVGGAAVGAFLGGSLGIGLIVLTTLACPLSMYLMMTQQRGSS